MAKSDEQAARTRRHTATEMRHSVSDMANEAARFRLAEDEDDIAAFEDRANEPSVRLEDALQHLKSGMD